MRLHWIGLLALAVVMSACSARPLPEQVSGFNTLQIVAKVRCEMRDGLRSYVLGYLDDPALQPNFRKASDLAEYLRRHEYEWASLRPLLAKYGADPVTMSVFETYGVGAIAYEFLFNGIENNFQSGSIDLLQSLTNGAISGNLSATSTFDRNNSRNFSIADNFEILTQYVNAEYCGPAIDSETQPEFRLKPNMFYPVSGSLGLGELVGAFLNLNQSGNLVGTVTAPNTAPLIPTIIEAMKFTTTVTGGGSFGFAAAAPTRPDIRLAKASVASANSRSDIHTLRIVIKLPAVGEKHVRTIAESRLIAQGVPLPIDRSPKSLIKTSALVDLSLLPEKEYIETKILVAQRLNLLLPE